MAGNHSDIIGWKHLPIFPQKLPVPFVPTQAAQQTRLVCCTGLKITFLCLSLIWFTIWPLGELYQHSYGSPAMGTGSGGGGKLLRKTLHPEGTRRSQENLRWVKRMMDKQKFTPGLQGWCRVQVHGAPEHWWCSGKLPGPPASPECASAKSWACKAPSLTLGWSHWWKQVGDHQQWLWANWRGESLEEEGERGQKAAQEHTNVLLYQCQGQKLNISRCAMSA